MELGVLQGCRCSHVEAEAGRLFELKCLDNDPASIRPPKEFFISLSTGSSFSWGAGVSRS